MILASLSMCSGRAIDIHDTGPTLYAITTPHSAGDLSFSADCKLASQVSGPCGSEGPKSHFEFVLEARWLGLNCDSAARAPGERIASLHYFITMLLRDPWAGYRRCGMQIPWCRGWLWRWPKAACAIIEPG